MFIRNQLQLLSLYDFYALLCSEEINLLKENRDIPPPIASTENSPTALYTQQGRGRTYSRNISRWNSFPSRRGGSAASPSCNSPIQCQICHKLGHSASQCWHRLNINYTPQQPPNPTTLQASSSDIQSNWLLDSGATNHLTPHYEARHQPQAYTGIE